VVSVGGITVGGSGKTPVAILIALDIGRRGGRVAYVTRGYGGRLGRAGAVVRPAGAGGLGAPDYGDEAYLAALRLPRAVVLRGADKAALLRTAARAHGAAAAVLDDGFQSRVGRDVDIVVLDATLPLGNGRVLPRGPLREPARALDRADLLWFHRVPPDGSLPDAAALLAARTGLPFVASREEVEGAVDRRLSLALEPRALRGRRCLLLAGTARPETFFEIAASLGVRETGRLWFGDHRVLTRRDLARVEHRARGAELILTTEKDLVRMPAWWDPGLPLLALRTAPRVVAGGEHLDRLIGRVAPAQSYPAGGGG
jgi:tetraacyldisaccharide 4'-kinase